MAHDTSKKNESNGDAIDAETKGSEKTQKPETIFRRLTKNVWVTSLLLIFIIGAIVAGAIYWRVSSERVYTDNAQISANVTDLSPTVSGPLQDVFVQVGDLVPANTVVAQVGNELIKTKTESVVVSLENTIGTVVAPGQAVVSVINPADLRLVARIDEDKGLSSIKIGQQAMFTVDAFGSRKFQGVVDEISPSAQSNDIVFTISDKRQTQVFDVKVRFDTTQYPDLQNGMSAKVWIYK